MNLRTKMVPRLSFRAGLGYVLMFCFLCGSSVAAFAEKGAEDQLKKMIAANSLDREGLAPFHVEITFNYYDLDGKLADSGSVEEWWVSDKQYRTVITSPALHEVFPAEPGAVAAPSRESYLVHELLKAEVHPIPRYSTLAGLEVRPAKHFADGSSLSCVVVEQVELWRPGAVLTTPTFCAEPATNALRMRSNLEASSVTRNSVATFHDVKVALDLQIAYGTGQHDQIAITGNVIAMQTFNPATTPLALGAPAADQFDEDAIPESFMKGKVLEQPMPYIPGPIRAAKTKGTVNLRGVVQKDGTVKALVVMSSFRKELSAPALESVENWKYKPYIIRDKPADVEANFYVGFSGPYVYFFRGR